MKNIELLSKIILFSPIFIFSLARLGEEFHIFRPGFLHDELIYLPLLIPIAVIGMIISIPATTKKIKKWKTINIVALVITIICLVGILISTWFDSNESIFAGMQILLLSIIGILLLLIGGINLSIAGSLATEPKTHKSLIILTIISVVFLGLSWLTLF